MSGKFWRNLFYSIAVILIAVFIYLLLNERHGQFLALLAAFICLVAARFDDLAKFKLSKDGLEGEMREVIDEARATLAQLHLLAEEQSRFMLWSMQSNGRWGGMKIESQDRMRASVVSTLKTLGVTEQKIEDVVSVEYPFIDFDYASYVTRKLGNGLNEDAHKAWNEFFSSERRKGIGFQPSPDELETFLASLDLVSDDVKQRLEDYRYFKKVRKHRRPEEWQNSRS
ncbi:hypothetical protein [Rhizobium sp. CECT 9324]|uniref:hypothetical protein n=1 Tax=Rhizobium sp. CECT 9324 TaxID=2845820 RepID=UPI001E4E1999|nr:hypothetical protein [Rhizobium sp. CECT 9324]CAH0339412.1 hypothetical protein RHI9324_01059 [Rhizobium sp. CECT 9324]